MELFYLGALLENINTRINHDTADLRIASSAIFNYPSLAPSLSSCNWIISVPSQCTCANTSEELTAALLLGGEGGLKTS